jgi:choline dehydrogenase-like flavoprotein
VQTWLADAQDNGAKIIKNCAVDKIAYENGKVSGIEATYSPPDSPDTTRKLILNAKFVVVCCGSLNSPALLLRSGLDNKHIGKNLRLHPVALIQVHQLN